MASSAVTIHNFSMLYNNIVFYNAFTTIHNAADFKHAWQ